MASLLERLQEALSPEYEVQQQLAVGGMGIVFLARHVGLDRRVAIKVLAPELASNAAAQRFLREARILASLSHSHVVPIHNVGETDGLFYYVMDYIDGETLGDALRRGPMAVGDVVKLGRDLLDALEAVHDRGVVHRDIKPANIFLSDKRTLLGDFGIAKQESGSDETLTQPGGVVGTPSRMPPEQTSGETVTERTDIYAVAMVLYEALTCRQWDVFTDPRKKKLWAGIPVGVARVLRRALAFDPADRWSDAVMFRKKLWGTRVTRYRWRTAALTAGGIVAGVLGAIIIISSPSSPSPGAVVVKLERFQPLGADPFGVADSLTTYVIRRLGQSIDFEVCELNATCRKATVTLHGSVTLSDSGFSVQVKTQANLGLFHTYESRWGRLKDWGAVADLVIYDVVVKKLFSQNKEFGELRDVLPKSLDGVNLWFDAERAFNEGRYHDAAGFYDNAVQQDNTCLLCSWRLLEIGRQRPGLQDAEVQGRVFNNKDSFPEWYQALIELELGSLPESERIPYLEQAVDRWPDFFYLRFRLGEEIFNRGPLWGRPRAEAMGHLEDALARQPGFAQALEHLAWVAIAEGDQEIAKRRLDELKALPTPTNPGSRPLIRIGFAYRFLEDEADNVGQSALEIPGIDTLPETAAGARLMPGFDSPKGAIDFGKLFENADRGGGTWKLAGLMGQMFGYLAMGQLASTRVHAREIVGMEQLGHNFRLFVAQLDAFLTLFDEEAAGLDRDSVIGRLQHFVPQDAASLDLRNRAAWTLSLLHRQAGADSAADSMRKLAGSPTDPLVILLDAHQLAAGGDFADALRRADPLMDLQRARFVREGLVGPFFRTVVHLLRARWYEANENLLPARGELLWHQNYDQDGLPLNQPRVEEVDWGFGTLARWLRAGVIEQIDSNDPELCRIYRDIERNWAEGDSVYVARADTAREKLGELDCEAITR